MAVSSLLNDAPHSDSYVGPSPGESIQYASEPCAKRRYRRHPKPDPNAPRKPQTAYIMFSNSIRSGGAYKHMSFTQSAQQVAEIWRTLAPHLRQPYLDRAEHERGVYREQIARYKLTPEYRDYQNYLRRFYSQAGQIVRSVGRPRKPAMPGTIHPLDARACWFHAQQSL
ncbi:hypothetical protein DSO57_1010622 [Entomophthora muscae]|uniref:Uncharacterized protein n=1 Tax=Entomophthora muscae TaxID=34485 RepID=A0ACC2RLA2_9FUNG|nr:hypothetical protein DSO57_1010622 [Entomophthora muscae]